MGKCRSKERKLILMESDNMLISELCEEERLHDEESSYDEKDSHDGEISVLLLVLVALTKFSNRTMSPSF